MFIAPCRLRSRVPANSLINTSIIQVCKLPGLRRRRSFAFAVRRRNIWRPRPMSILPACAALKHGAAGSRRCRHTLDVYARSACRRAARARPGIRSIRGAVHDLSGRWPEREGYLFRSPRHWMAFHARVLFSMRDSMPSSIRVWRIPQASTFATGWVAASRCGDRSHRAFAAVGVLFAAAADSWPDLLVQINVEGLRGRLRAAGGISTGAVTDRMQALWDGFPRHRRHNESDLDSSGTSASDREFMSRQFAAHPSNNYPENLSTSVARSSSRRAAPGAWFIALRQCRNAADWVALFARRSALPARGGACRRALVRDQPID